LIQFVDPISDTTLNETPDSTPDVTPVVTIDDPDLDLAVVTEPENLPVSPLAVVADDDDGADAAVEVSADTLDIEDSTRLYLREIARVPLLTAEEEVVLAKAIELGLRIRTEPWTAILDLHEWASHATEPTAREKHAKYALPRGEEATRIVREALTDDAAGDLLVTAPRFGFTEAVSSAPTTGAPCWSLTRPTIQVPAVSTTSTFGTVSPPAIAIARDRASAKPPACASTTSLPFATPRIR